MTYARLQTVQTRMDELQDALRSAILAEDTRDIERYRGMAHAIARDMERELASAVADHRGAEALERQMARSALTSLQDAIDYAQRVELGANTAEMRTWLLDFKTRADFAAAYLLASLGFERV